MKKRLVIVASGEPAGVGLDVLLRYLDRYPGHRDRFLVVGDERAFCQRAKLLGIPADAWLSEGALLMHAVRAPQPVVPGTPDPQNAPYVKEVLRIASDLAHTHSLPMITLPVQKSLLSTPDYTFRGQTEYLAEHFSLKGEDVVMMFFSDRMRLALATNHLALRDVPSALNEKRLHRVFSLVLSALRAEGILSPKVAVCGLNPHCGEEGSFGSEEHALLIPAIERFLEPGIEGPFSADTIFTRPFDAYIAMYHDQGLSAFKVQSFGKSFHRTLGLPIARISVDHGTAFDKVGSDRVDWGAFAYASEKAFALL